MSVYNFFASNAVLESVINEKVFFFSFNEALERGIKIPWNIADKDKKNTILYVKNREDLDEIEISPGHMIDDENNYTKMKYRASLHWVYTEKRAEQLLDYIKQHLQKTNEIELWKIWLGEKEKPDIICCKLCDLDNKKIKSIFGKNGFKKPLCLKVIKDGKCQDE